MQKWLTWTLSLLMADIFIYFHYSLHLINTDYFTKSRRLRNRSSRFLSRWAALNENPVVWWKFPLLECWQISPVTQFSSLSHQWDYVVLFNWRHCTLFLPSIGVKFELSQFDNPSFNFDLQTQMSVRTKLTTVMWLVRSAITLKDPLSVSASKGISKMDKINV